MGTFVIMSWMIIAIISFIFAPLMTIGVIFLSAGWKIAGIIFILIGIIRMFYKITLMANIEL